MFDEYTIRYILQKLLDVANLKSFCHCIQVNRFFYQIGKSMLNDFLREHSPLKTIECLPEWNLGQPARY